MITFDYTNSYINVPQADAQPLTIQALVNAIRAQESSVQGVAYPAIAGAVGKDALGGSSSTGITLTLLGAWKINFASGAYQATINGGNLADALNRIVNTGSPQVLIQQSAAATEVASGGGGGSAPSVAQIWSEDPSGYSGTLTMGGVLTLALKLLRNKTVTDPATGIMTVYADDGVTVLLQGALFEDVAGSQAYRGKGADRRERLA